MPPVIALDKTGLPNVVMALPSGMRQLTPWEYDNAVRDLLGEPSPDAERLKDTFGDFRTPFDNQIASQTISNVLVTGVEDIARNTIVAFLKDTARRTRILGCPKAGLVESDCLQSVVENIGRQAWRRPISKEDAKAYVDFFGMRLAGQSFDNRLEAVLTFLLVHPEFSNRVEIGTEVGENGIFKLNRWELASRISFFLWGSAPGDGLMKDPRLDDISDKGVRAVAREMLADSRAMPHIGRMLSMWLHYEKPVVPTPDALRKDMLIETGALVKRVLFDEKDTMTWQDLFRYKSTFVTPLLAKHYGMPAMAAPAWVPYVGRGRAGLLGQGSFLANGYKFGDTSPTMRGVIVREDLLCLPRGTIPPEAKADDAPPSNAVCKADRYKESYHQPGTACRGCHEITDYIGFGLEQYDNLGRFRENENTYKKEAPNCPIDGQGRFSGKSFNGPAELADTAVQDPGFNACTIRHLHQFLVGRSADQMTDRDTMLVKVFSDRTDGKAFGFQALLLDIVSSPAFAHRRNDELKN